MRALQRVSQRLRGGGRWAHAAAATGTANVDKIHIFDNVVSGCNLLEPKSSNRCPISATSNGRRSLRLFSGAHETRLSVEDQQELEQLREGYEQLVAIQNVGTKNAELLLAAGCTDRKSLAEKLLAENVLDDDDRAVRYLKSTVGIKRTDYAMSIIREARRERTQWDPQVTMCVEGNISVGKTTFLEQVCSTSAELNGKVHIEPEPIAQWTNTPHGGHNLLEKFYEDPEKNGYMFQNYVFCTRVEQERGKANTVGEQELPLRLLERSVFSDLQVFVRAGVKQGYLTDFQRDVYLSSVKPIIKSVPSLQPDAFVYLRADPQTCHQRLLQRSRAEETGVGLDYLEQLHQYHEEWMTGHQVPIADTGGLNVIKFNESGLPFHPATERTGGDLHAKDRQTVSLLGIPVLVLDCEPDIVTDPDAREEYSRTLHAFWKYAAQQRRASHDSTDDYTHTEHRSFE
eukprot:COSAG02_NODE_533_length_20665_cov_216.617281_15_plen_457_part_00